MPYNVQLTYSQVKEELKQAIINLVFFFIFSSELPDSILTQELHGQFEQATAIAEPQREATMLALIAKLPPPNYSLLGWLMRHFECVVANEQVSLMCRCYFFSTIGVSCRFFYIEMTFWTRLPSHYCNVKSVWKTVYQN